MSLFDEGVPYVVEIGMCMVEHRYKQWKKKCCTTESSESMDLTHLGSTLFVRH